VKAVTNARRAEREWPRIRTGLAGRAVTCASDVTFGGGGCVAVIVIVDAVTRTCEVTLGGVCGVAVIVIVDFVARVLCDSDTTRLHFACLFV
jgi:hypothetical protein